FVRRGCRPKSWSPGPSGRRVGFTPSARSRAGCGARAWGSGGTSRGTSDTTWPSAVTPSGDGTRPLEMWRRADGRRNAIVSPQRTLPRSIPMTTPVPAAQASAGDRATVVRRDLDNVLHPIVAHRQLEAEPMVIVKAHGSTVVDADGSEYLDAMAGLWCVNVGDGRTEPADVAAAQMPALPHYPHPAMNPPAAAPPERGNNPRRGDHPASFL